MDGPFAHGGLVVNASEVGLLIQSVRNIPMGEKLTTVILFPKGFELASLEVLGEVIWKDIYREEDWEGFYYGLNFINILAEERNKLRRLLRGEYDLEEIPGSTSSLPENKGAASQAGPKVAIKMERKGI